MRTMPQTIRVTRTLTPQEHETLFEWGDDIFGDGIYQITWRPKEWHLLLMIDGILVSHIGLLRQTVVVEGQPIDIGGVGSVVTIPGAQRRGYARTALQHATDFLTHDLGVAFGLLFCGEHMIAYYARAGWQRIHAPVMIEQPEESILSPFPIMIRACGEQPWPDGIVELRSLPW